MVVRGAYTISSFMEGTGTNLRLPLNPPLAAETTTLYNTPADTYPKTTLDQGLFGLNNPDPYHNATIRLWDPNVRPAEVQQWNLTVEVPTAFRERADRRLRRTAWHAPDGRHAVPPEAARQRTDFAQPVSGRQPDPAGRHFARFPGLAPAPISGMTACRRRLHKRFNMGLEYQLSYTFSKGMSDSIGYYGEGGQAGGQSAYMQNLYDRKSRVGADLLRQQACLHGLLRLPIAVRPEEEVRLALEQSGGWRPGRLANQRHPDRAHGLPADHQDERRSLRHGRAEFPRQRDRHTERSAPDRTRPAVPGSHALIRLRPPVPSATPA